ncbi:MAG: cytosine permease, partial [Oscillospiraceae bacterium]|nr:cytosine permease [Oscillospiraceae bacterium]
MNINTEDHIFTNEIYSEVQTSKYYNNDLSPADLSKRTWGTYTFFSCWVGMNICIPAYQMASSAIAMGLSWWLSLVLVFSGNLIILIPMLLNSRAGIKYGITFPVYARSVFGIRGAQIPVIIRSVIGAAWTGILIWLGAESLQVALELIFEPWQGFRYGQAVCYIFFWILNIGFTLGGSDVFKKLKEYSTPLLGLFCIGLSIWGIRATYQAGYVAIDAIRYLNISSNINVRQTITVFLVANISYYSTWAMNVSDLSRFAKNEKSHHIGIIVGLPLSMMLIAFCGIFVTGASKLIFGEPMWNPNDVVLAIGNRWGALFAAIAILLATLSTNVTTNILPPANGLTNLYPRKVSYKTGVIITGIIATAIQPWRLVADPSGYIYDWLSTYGILTGPFASILICDYFLFKKQTLSLVDLYSGHGSNYWYYKGFNLRAILAWCFAVIPSIAGIFIAPLRVLRDYGWILSFVLGFIIYFILTKV